VGLGLGVALGAEVELVADGVGVESACEVVAPNVTLNARIITASTDPTFGVSADPKGLTLSSIRRISLCMSDR